MSVPRPRVFAARFNPHTGQLLPVKGAQPMLGNPLARRRRGLGDIPTPSGGPGNPVEPYDETEVWNGIDVSAPPAPGTPVTSGNATANASATANVSFPFGETDRLWSNPTTFSSIPITGSGVLLTQNNQRNSLIIQNNSSATSPDVAPTFYIGFNAAPAAGFALALAPGVGFSWDIITPRDTIYLLIGTFSGPSVKIAGTVVQGTYSPPVS